ncbi:MAG: thiamine phosphate synthase [Verrucomicrobiaceae bacterium]|nr:MAG: thiamine phosphate synthase [Verrucomicrobiaceae bacterium]
MKIPSRCYLYGILDLGYVDPANALRMTRLMLDGGVGMIQLRAKTQDIETVRAIALRIAPLCHEAGVPFILNDHPQLVAETGANGVHVGQDDMPIAKVRAMIGPEAIIGLSTHSLAQAMDSEGADYIGFGPLFATPTKPDYKPVGLRDVAEVHRRVSVPIFCIGGIKLENLSEVLAAGAKRAVVVSGILQSSDPAAYCQKCMQILA